MAKSQCLTNASPLETTLYTGPAYWPWSVQTTGPKRAQQTHMPILSIHIYCLRPVVKMFTSLLTQQA